PHPGCTGASIFFAAFDKEEEEAARASVGSSIAEPGINGRLSTLGRGSRDIELVLWDLAQTRHVDRSGNLARILAELFRDRVPLSAHAVERAPLRVLESANMPAVLIEMGCLSNPDQEKQLTSNEFQSVFVQTIVEAVVRFRDSLDAAGRPGAQ